MNRRLETRRRVAISAIVSDACGLASHTCAIRDASSQGCKLVSSNLDEFPTTIKIVVDGVDRPIFGQIVWRDRRMAGVRFEWPDRMLLSDRSTDWLDFDAYCMVD